MAILVFDFGGSAVKYGVWVENELRQQNRFTTPKDWEEMKKQLLLVFEEAKQNYPIEGVAISAPGAVQEEQGVIGGASAIPYIHEFPIIKSLADLFQLPVAVENDANCAALAEMWLGAAKGIQNLLFVVLGTGVGGAVVANGKIIPGKHMLGGEFGFMLLTETQTFSDLGTAVNLEKRYAKRLGLDQPISAINIFELAQKGDKVAAEEVETFYYYLAKGLFNLQYAFDPELILIGGGISAKEDLIPEIEKQFEKLKEVVPIATIMPNLAICQFKNDANLIGAVYHFYDKFGYLPQ